MKGIMNSLSSLSDCDPVEDKRSQKSEWKDLQKIFHWKTQARQPMNPLVMLKGLGKNFSLKDRGAPLLSFKHETTNTITSLNTAFNQFRLELQEEMKLIRDEMVEQKNSSDRAWAEVEALQAEMVEQKAEIQILKKQS